jgi:hypothetical protein
LRRHFSFHGGRRCGSRLSAGCHKRSRLPLPRGTTRWDSRAAPGSQPFRSHPLLRTSLSTSSPARSRSPDSKHNSYRVRFPSEKGWHYLSSRLGLSPSTRYNLSTLTSS